MLKHIRNTNFILNNIYTYCTNDRFNHAYKSTYFSPYFLDFLQRIYYFLDFKLKSITFTIDKVT